MHRLREALDDGSDRAAENSSAQIPSRRSLPPEIADNELTFDLPVNFRSKAEL